MMIEQKFNKPCRFWKLGTCNKGDKCPYLHTGPPGNSGIFPQNSQSSNQQSSTCWFFMSQDGCTKQNCPYFHGYLEKLEIFAKLQEHQIPITGLVRMDNQKFITVDSKEFYIRFIDNLKTPYKNSIDQDGLSVCKLIFSGNKVICGVQKEGM